ncbi:MAG: hypothetical protein ACRCX2_26320 [Paraclostridium sp.]
MRMDNLEGANLYYQDLGDRIVFSNTYMIISAEKEIAKFEREFEKNEKLQDYILKFNSERNIKLNLQEEFEKLDIIECSCCKGTGYEKDCNCGHDLMGDMVLDFYDLEIEGCEKCENTGTVSASKEEEGSYVCVHCGGTGKVVRGENRGNEKFIKLGESYLKKSSFKNVIDVCGKDIDIFVSGKELDNFIIIGNGFFGYLASCHKPKEEK